MEIRETSNSAQPAFLIMIAGATGVGKTEFALGMATTFDGEIVSGDAAASYRYLDIGTAKPGQAERQRVRHHLIDILDPAEVLTVAQFQERAYQAIADITDRGKVPFMVGGSGLYMHAVAEGWVIPAVAPDPELRQALEQAAQAQGAAWLHAQLAAVDPLAAGQIEARNVRRVIRALEVYQVTGIPISQLQTKKPPNYRVLWIGLHRERSVLFERIDQRVELMISHGLIDEVRVLLERGYAPDSPAFAAIGYRQAVAFLQGQMDLAAAIAEIKTATHRLARQQTKSWFRRDDPMIHWFDLDDPAASQHICKFLNEAGLGPNR